jgi:hypothetical protein
MNRIGGALHAKRTHPPSSQPKFKLKQYEHPSEDSQVDARISELQAKFEEVIKKVDGKHFVTVDSILQGTNLPSLKMASRTRFYF